MKPKSKILIIAGSDSSGGAGIQADIKTVTALGSYAMTAITAVTAQNTRGVKKITPIPIIVVDDGSVPAIDAVGSAKTFTVWEVVATQGPLVTVWVTEYDPEDRYV